jgi:hypothetical protein
MELLWSADNFLSNLDCAALRAMTGLEGESAVTLFGLFMQFLVLCGAIHNQIRNTAKNRGTIIKLIFRK